MSRADQEASCRKGRLSSEGKAMWPFYKVRLRMRVLRGEQGKKKKQNKTHACFMCDHLDHVFCTVTCILETLSHWWLLCLFIGPFKKWTIVNKDMLLFFFKFYALFLYTKM